MPERSRYDAPYGYRSRPPGRRGAGRGPAPPRGARPYDDGVGSRYDAPPGRHPGPAGAGPYVPYAAAPGPYIPLGWDPMLRWDGWEPGLGLVPFQDRPPPGRPRRAARMPPERSPAFGRGGDRAVRQWARRYGYDVDVTLPPRRPPGRPRDT